MGTRQKVHELIKRIAMERKMVDPKVVTQQLFNRNNFTTDIFTAKITSANNEVLNLFAKIGTVPECLRATMNRDYIYRTEKYFYTELAKTYTGLLDKHQVPESYRFKFPKYYGSSDQYGEEIIVLEDLVESGYNEFERFQSLSWEQASRSVEMLANFHALSFAYEREDPNAFNATARKLQFFTIVKNADVQKATYATIKEALPMLKEQDRKRVWNVLEDTGNKFYRYSMPLDTPVLVHGDYRPCNIMQKVKNGMTMPVPVDFQTVHLGCAANDLVYFSFMASDQKFRRDHLEALIDHYYIHLGQAMKKMGMLINDVYPRSSFDLEFRHMLPVSLLASILVLPVVCVQPHELMPSLTTVEGSSVPAVKLNDIFRERFTGIVEDCISMGVI